MSNDGTQAAEELVAEITGKLLQAHQVTKLQQRVLELTAACMTLELVGTAEEVSQAIGRFQFLKGKADAFNELLLDHEEAVAELQAARVNQNAVA